MGPPTHPQVYTVTQTTYSILEDALPLRNPARNTMLAPPAKPQAGREGKFQTVTPEILKDDPALDSPKAEATLLVMGKAVKSVICGDFKNTGTLSFKGRAAAQEAPHQRPKIIDNSEQPDADMTFEQDVNMCVVSRGKVETNGISFEDM